MSQRILIVEDQFLIALNIEDAVLGLGYHVVGIASSSKDVDQVHEPVDIALVDVNLLDGPTGPEIGETLAARGCSVIFMTGNPELVANGVDGALGYISKPVFDLDLINVIEYAASVRSGMHRSPPQNLKLFGDGQAAAPMMG